MLGRVDRRGKPEWYILGKPHPDRAKQFKPFAALRGYEEMVDAAIGHSKMGGERSAQDADLLERWVVSEERGDREGSYGISSSYDPDAPIGRGP